MAETKWYEAFAQYRTKLASWLVFVLVHSIYLFFFKYL